MTALVRKNQQSLAKIPPTSAVSCLGRMFGYGFGAWIWFGTLELVLKAFPSLFVVTGFVGLIGLALILHRMYKEYQNFSGAPFSVTFSFESRPAEIDEKKLFLLMFPQGIPEGARTIVLLDKETYLQWRDRFQQIAPIAVSAGPIVACRWPRNPRYQERALGLVVKVLQEMNCTRSVIYSDKLAYVRPRIAGILWGAG